jgi:group I intron endonuclease
MTGIYGIRNTINQKLYIGSSKNIDNRVYNHFSNLKNNNHKNKHLQAAYNKYGKDVFKIEILESCTREVLLQREQYYIDSYPWETLYNKTKNATGGGSDVLCIPVYVIDLKGLIVYYYESINSLKKN